MASIFVWSKERKESSTECFWCNQERPDMFFFSLPYPNWSLLFLSITTSILCCILLLALEYVAVLAQLGEKWLSSRIWAKANYPSGGVDHF